MKTICCEHIAVHGRNKEADHVKAYVKARV